MLILAGVDPGPTPGFAIKIDSQYITTTFSSPRELYLAIREYKPDKLAVEMFYRSNRIDAWMIRTMECVGGVQAACAVLDIPCYHHTPGHQRSWVLDARPHLPKGYTAHEESALAHLMLFEDNIKKGKAKL